MSFKVGEVLDPDVNPFYQIIGREGETGKIRLREGYSRSHVFTKGNTYKMSVKSPDIGEVCIREPFRAIFEGIVIIADEKILHEKLPEV